MSSTTVGQQKGGIFYGWWMVASGFVMALYAYGAWYYGFGVFFNPMSKEFGWSAAETAGAFSLRTIEGGLEGPVVGVMLDRIGARIVMMVSFTMAGLGFIALSFIDNLIMFYIIYGLFISLGLNAGLYTSSYKAVGSWFVRKRSTAISIMTVGGALGGTVVVPIAAMLITAYGWRFTAQALGVMMIVIGIPSAMIFKPKAPEHYGLLPDGNTAVAETESAAKTVAAAAQAKTAKVEVEFSVKEAMVTSTFWITVAAFTLNNLGLNSVTVHQINLARSIGIDLTMAAAAFGAMTAISIPGRLILGSLGDRVSVRYLLAMSFGMQCIGMFFLGSANDMNGIWMAMVAYGLGYGAAIPLSPVLRTQYFGRKSYATLQGLYTLVTMVGGVIGPVFAGWVFDVTKSYSQAFYGIGAAFVIATLLITIAKPPKPPKRILDEMNKVQPAI